MGILSSLTEIFYPMKRYHCDKCGIDTVVYLLEEQRYFRDDNRKENAIFVDKKGNKVAKRFIDFNCKVFQKALIL